MPSFDRTPSGPQPAENDKPEASRAWNDCPICGRPGLDKGEEHCPQCGADLECFELLNDLREPNDLENLRSRGKGAFPLLSKINRLTFALLPVALIGFALTSAYLGVRVDRLIHRFDGRMEQLTDRLAMLPVYREPARKERADHSLARSADGIPSRISDRIPDNTHPHKDSVLFLEELETKAAGPITGNRAVSLEASEFAKQISDFDQRRIIAVQRIEAALAKYTASASMDSKFGR